MRVLNGAHVNRPVGARRRDGRAVTRSSSSSAATNSVRGQVVVARHEIGMFGDAPARLLNRGTSAIQNTSSIT